MSAWFTRQAKANPDLFRVIYDFNRRPQNWVHPEVLRALPNQEIINTLSTTNHGSSHLAAWLEHELNLDYADPCWDFEAPDDRFVLLSSGSLHKLACYAGAAAYWPRIATTISREDLLEIKTLIGEGAYVFAMRRGRTIVAESEAALPSNEQSLADHAIKVGWGTVAAAVHDERSGVQQRFALKLPPAMEHLLVKHAAASADEREEARRRLRKISPEVLTEGESKCFV